MKLHSQFLKLHSQHGGPAEISVTLDELALTLGCTHRNALHVIRKNGRSRLDQLDPQPGPGGGAPSWCSSQRPRTLPWNP
ncbi:SgrR family transcriptional regulator [Paenibacillus rhizoplanae]